MATYTLKNINKLAVKIKNKSKIVDKASVDTVNKSATFSIAAAIDEISREVNLQPAYLKSNIKTVGRASQSNIRAIVAANMRATLLNRYPVRKTSDGYAVAINKTGGYRNIVGAKMMSLRGSGGRSIGMRNKDFAEAMGKVLNVGKKTPAKSAKFSRIVRKAYRKPYGMTPLHSRSINQLFTTARVDIQPQLGRFMRKTFLEDFRRYESK